MIGNGRDLGFHYFALSSLTLSFPTVCLMVYGDWFGSFYQFLRSGKGEKEEGGHIFSP